MSNLWAPKVIVVIFFRLIFKIMSHILLPFCALHMLWFKCFEYSCICMSVVTRLNFFFTTFTCSFISGHFWGSLHPISFSSFVPVLMWLQAAHSDMCKRATRIHKQIGDFINILWFLCSVYLLCSLWTILVCGYNIRVCRKFLLILYSE